MASELLPCPFCGGERASAIPANRNSTERLYPIVRCMGCFTDVPGKTNDFSLDCRTAIAAWNRRAPSPSPAPGVVEDWDIETTADQIARQLAAEVKSFGPTGRIHGETYAAAKAGAFEAFKRALASLSQPAKGEREGGGD